ncbi:MAG: flagellar hook assembly protein FlgD [Sandaracinaceae bacterium]|nr:flagellar hook assembly protein FlgD [Sandaracinaceae bacterium]
MEIDNNNTAVALGAPRSPAAGGNGQLDGGAFMQLLVAQIRNQDPANPMDSRELMTQLTQLTSVEHLIGIEDRLTSLSIASAGIANAQVAGFVGKTVEADTSTLRLEDAGGVSTGFELPAATASTTITIRDQDGDVVRTIELGGQGAGPSELTWDGRDDDGQRLPAGSYRMEVAATDEQGHPLEARTRVRGVVTGISYEQGFPELVIGERRVLMGDVRRVEDTPTSTLSSTSTVSSTTSREETQP